MEVRQNGADFEVFMVNSCDEQRVGTVVDDEGGLFIQTDDGVIMGELLIDPSQLQDGFVLEDEQVDLNQELNMPILRICHSPIFANLENLLEQLRTQNPSGGLTAGFTLERMEVRIPNIKPEPTDE